MQPIRSHGDHCVGCGKTVGSLGLQFHLDGDRVVSPVRFDERHQGAPGFAHGGMLATALDDVLGTVLFLLRKPAVTAKLEIDYRRPAFIDVDYTVAGWSDRTDGRKLFLEGDIRDADGAVVAQAHALFLEVDIAHFAQNGQDMPAHVKKRWVGTAKELPY